MEEVKTQKELTAENALLRQLFGGLAKLVQSVPVHYSVLSPQSSPITQIVSSSQFIEDIPLLEMQIHIESAHKRLREFEQQAEMAR